jgi:membrane protease YdiL (CAAX protease family)
MINTRILFRNTAIILLAPTTFILLYDIIFYYIPISNNNYSYIDGSYLSLMLLMDFFALAIFIYFYINKIQILFRMITIFFDTHYFFNEIK